MRNNFAKILKNIGNNKTFYYFLCLLCFSFLIHQYSQNNSDEGIITAGAWNMINGKEIYTDFFEFITPGSFYLIFFTWKIFGVSFFTAKAISIFILSLCAFGIFKISSEFEKNFYTYLVPFLYIFSTNYWPIINHNFYNIFFVIWSLYFFINFLKNKKKSNLIFSAILTCLSMLFLQHKGFLIFVSIFSFLLYKLYVNKNKAWFYFLVLYSSISILPLLLLLMKWPSSLLYYNLIHIPFFRYTEINKMPLTLFFIFILFYTYFFFTILIHHLKSNHQTIKNSIFYFLFFTQLLFLLSSLQRPDLFHVILSIFILISLTPYIVKIINLNKNYFLRHINYCILILFMFFIISAPISFLLSTNTTSNQKMENLLSFIDKNCKSKYIYAGPFLPNMYFSTKKINPINYDLLLTGHNTSQHFLDSKQKIETHKPDCVILNYEKVKKFKYNTNNPVDKYISKNYHSVLQIPNSSIEIHKINNDIN